MSINKQQSGFTLIELVVVIVILGILAATAIPKFVDLSNEAAKAAVDGVAGGVTSASAINYAASKANTAKAFNVASCADALKLVDGLNGKYNPSGTAPTWNTNGTPVDCVIAGEKGTTATAKVLGVTGATALP